MAHCKCEEDDITVELAHGDYTTLEFHKDKYGVEIIARGEGEAYWEPIYCPLCGRRLKE